MVIITKVDVGPIQIATHRIVKIKSYNKIAKSVRYKNLQFYSGLGETLCA